MPYVAQISQNERISIRNEGTKSVITLIDPSGQIQDRSATVESGAWVSPPTLFQIANGLVWRFHTDEGHVFFRIQDGQINRLSDVPSLSGARSLSLRPSQGGQIPPRGVRTTPLSPPPAPPGGGASRLPPLPPSRPPALPRAGASRLPSTPPPPPAAPQGAGVGASRVPPSPPPAPPGSGSGRVNNAAPPSPPDWSSRVIQRGNPFYEKLKRWGIVTGILVVILVMEVVLDASNVRVGNSLVYISWMVQIAWVVQTANTFWGGIGRLVSWVTQRIHLPKNSAFAKLLPSILFGIFFFLLCNGLVNVTSFIDAVLSGDVRRIIGTGLDWFLWIWIFIGFSYFFRSKIVVWQETNNTAHHLIPNMADKSEEVYDRMVKRIEERVPPDLLVMERVQLTEAGHRTMAEFRTVEQLTFTYGRARVIFRSKRYGKDLYVRWDSYLDFSARRIYIILSVINMAFTNFVRIVVGPVIFDIQMAFVGFINLLFYYEKDSTGGQEVGGTITPIDNVFFSLNWNYLSSYTIDNLQALEEAVTSSAEEVLDQLAAQSDRDERIDIDIDRSRSRYNRLF